MRVKKIFGFIYQNLFVCGLAYVYYENGNIILKFKFGKFNKTRTPKSKLTKQ